MFIRRSREALVKRSSLFLVRWALDVAAVVRRVIGVPDYDRYVAHVRSRHPEHPLPTREEFMRECLTERYNRPGSRCC